MQKATAPRAPKAPKEEPKAPVKEPVAASADDEIAAVAMALYLAGRSTKHDLPTAMISLHGQHETAWNTKSIGLNNIGF